MKTAKRTIAMLLTLCMVLSLIPVTALGAQLEIAPGWTNVEAAREAAASASAAAGSAKETADSAKAAQAAAEKAQKESEEAAKKAKEEADRIAAESALNLNKTVAVIELNEYAQKLLKNRNEDCAEELAVCMRSRKRGCSGR